MRAPARLLAAYRLGCASAGAAALGLAAACGPSAEEREAAAVLHAADALRNAPSEPNSQREALLAELTQQPATAPLARDARDACARAYRPLLEGRALSARVKAALQAPSPQTASAAPRLAPQTPTGMLADLASAETKIKESAAAMPACDSALAELRRDLRQ